MASLKITTPDGKTLRVNIPEGTDPAQYSVMADEAVQHYMGAKGPQLMGSLTPDTDNTNVDVQGAPGAEGSLMRPEPFYTAGKGVEAGYAGLADLVTGKGLPKSADTVERVMDEKPLDTKAGKVGKFAGSFFTPIQIAMTAAGGAAAKPIANGLKLGLNKIGSLVAPASENALPGAAKGVANALSTVSGVAAPELETVMLNPNAVRSAKAFPALAEDVAGSMNKLSTHIDDLEKVMMQTLDPKKTMQTQVLKDSLQNEIAMLRNADVVTPEMESAKKVLETMAEKLKDKAVMTEPEVAKWVKSVQGKINWNNPLGSELNEAMTHVQSTVNGALKAQNPTYGKAIDKFSDAINLKNELTGAMGVDKAGGIGGKFAPENVSVTKLKGLLEPDKAIQTKKLLRTFSDIPGVPNYEEMARQSAARAATQQGGRARLAAFLAGLTPGLGNAGMMAATGGVTALPSAANLVYQGLRNVREGQ